MKKIFALGSIFLLLVITIITILIGRTSALGGERIVFASERDGNPDIFSIDIDGKNLKNLTSHPAIDYSPAPSPNGKYIAFNSWRKGIPQIFIMDADGRNPKLLIDEQVIDRPTWSPDSRWVAYVKRLGTIVAVNINNGEVKMIFDTPHTLTKYTSWSPDGQKIAFRIVAAKPDEKGDIYTIDVDRNLNGKNLKQLTDNPVNDIFPSWSPDSKQIVFYSDRDGGGIFIMDSDGKNVKQIHKNSDDCCPSWSPDGKKIVFNSGFRIFVMNLDGSDVNQVFDDVEGGGAGAPSWLGQRFFSVESEGKWKTTWSKIKRDF